jgi:hypothetical protein
VQAQYRDGQTFITWSEISGSDPETNYRIYSASGISITTDNLEAAELVDEVSQGSANFSRLAENNGRLSTPFSNGPLPNGIGLYVYTVESSGTHYYAVTSVVRGNENRTIGPGNGTGPISETVAPVSPVLQFMENSDPLASGNRRIFIVWLGRFDPTGRYSDYGYANRRSVPYIFRVTTPEVWNPANTYPLLVLFHFFSDSYFGGGHSVPEPGRFVLAADDFDPMITANLYGASMWYGYNSNYGTRRAPTDGVVVNYTERRVDWIIDWVMKRSGIFKIDSNRVYMKGGSMGGVAQWAYGIRHANLFAAGETAVPGVNLNFDPNSRHFPLWGYEPSIMTNDGVKVTERVNASSYVTAHPEIDFPLMLMFARKGDDAILWGQMPPFFAAMDSSRHIGGMLYWLQGDHVNGEFPWEVFSEWRSQSEYEDWIYQFVRNQSYPAFSRFSLNGNPGNGDPANGDLRGGFNRFPRWDITNIVDTPTRWEMTLRLHTAAPVSTATADVTPRRLQALTHTPGMRYSWENRQQPSNTVVQSGTVVVDANGLIALPNVILTKDGNQIVITNIPIPVELSSFVAHIQGNNILLQWETRSESNNYGFEIERRCNGEEEKGGKGDSASGAGWVKVAFIQGQGTSATPHRYSFADNNVSIRTYAYRLKQIDHNGAFVYSNEIEVTIGMIPNTIMLEQNFPNPFNPTTTIEFALPQSGFVTLKMFDVLGREVATLVNDWKEAGSYKIAFDIRNSTFAISSSGVYFYQMQAGAFVQTKKLMLLR